MKKIVTVIISGVMSLSLIGCANKKEAVDTEVKTTPTQNSSSLPSKEPIPAETSTLTPTPIVTIPVEASATPLPVALDRVNAFSEDKYYEEFYYEDKILYLTIDVTYPVLKGKSDVIDTINKDIQKRKEEYIAFAMENKELILEDPAYLTGDSFYSYDLSKKYSILYNKNGILNITYNGYDYLGGAHGMPIQESVIYDLKTGKQLKLVDFLAVDEKTFHDRVYAEFEKQYYENPENFFEGESLTYMDEGINLDMNFHLGGQGITFYFYPYDVSFYAAGFIETTLPFTDPIFIKIN